MKDKLNNLAILLAFLVLELGREKTHKSKIIRLLVHIGSIFAAFGFRFVFAIDLPIWRIAG